MSVTYLQNPKSALCKSTKHIFLVLCAALITVTSDILNRPMVHSNQSNSCRNEWQDLRKIQVLAPYYLYIYCQGFLDGVSCSKLLSSIWNEYHYHKLYLAKRSILPHRVLHSKFHQKPALWKIHSPPLNQLLMHFEVITFKTVERWFPFFLFLRLTDRINWTFWSYLPQHVFAQ